MLQLFSSWILQYAAHTKNKFGHPWIITCIHRLRHLQNYLQMQMKQLITAVKTFLKPEFNKSPCCHMV